MCTYYWLKSPGRSILGLCRLLWGGTQTHLYTHIHGIHTYTVYTHTRYTHIHSIHIYTVYTYTVYTNYYKHVHEEEAHKHINMINRLYMYTQTHSICDMYAYKIYIHEFVYKHLHIGLHYINAYTSYILIFNTHLIQWIHTTLY